MSLGWRSSCQSCWCNRNFHRRTRRFTIVTVVTMFWRRYRRWPLFWSIRCGKTFIQNSESFLPKNIWFKKWLDYAQKHLLRSASRLSTLVSGASTVSNGSKALRSTSTRFLHNLKVTSKVNNAFDIALATGWVLRGKRLKNYGYY